MLATLEGYNLRLKMLELRVLSLDRGPAVRDLESGARGPGLPMLELGIHSLDWGPTVGGHQSGRL